MATVKPCYGALRPVLPISVNLGDRRARFGPGLWPGPRPQARWVGRGLRRSRVGPEDRFCEAVRNDLRVPLTLEGPTRTMRGVPVRRLVAVGTAVASGPPRRSQRALLTHWAPASGAGVEPHARPGVHDPGLG